MLDLKSITVKEITITRAEGPTQLCGREMKFISFESASKWLLSESPTFPRNGGSDKHDFRVEFSDGVVYSGRLECQNHSQISPDLDLKKHIIRWIEKRIAVVTDTEIRREYRDFMKRYLGE